MAWLCVNPKAWKHTLGTAQSEDQCLCTEEDELYYVGIAKSKSDRFLYINMESSETTEWRYVRGCLTFHNQPFSFRHIDTRIAHR